MKILKTLLLLILLALIITPIKSQEINGEILSEDNNIKIIRVWGTHEERGYATGYLLADNILDLYENFIIPSFGDYMSLARMVISNPAHFNIPQEYQNEAMSMIEGIMDAGHEIEADYIDILLANSFLDVANIGMLNLNLKNGCSSLLSWGNATADTELNGKSVITRHMDWNDMDVIIRNQAMVIHLPDEEDEQPWLLIGFAGQISVLSGFNKSGLAVMQHMLADNYSSGSLNRAYEPIWFTLRKIIEKKDINGDEENNAKDIYTGIKANANGYADGYIITGIAPATFANDSLTAIIAEIAPSSPYMSFRYNTYEDDNIPGDNLYAANSSISRNDAQNFCMRYNAIISNIKDGLEISAEESWSLMLEYSSTCAYGGPGNIQFMQYVPENNYLKLAVHLNDGTQACENTALEFDTDELFIKSPPITNIIHSNDYHVNIFPNPSKSSVNIYFDNQLSGSKIIEIYSIEGSLIRKIQTTESIIIIDNIIPGIYIASIRQDDKVTVSKKFVIIE